ncbi:MAG: aconitate hydratase [Elusimicrobia bacterium]|nr:aconitate hydratase [Elusimicrobiota bacterium]
MGLNLTQKIIGKHLVGGEPTPGSEIAVKIDQTLTQDATGTMAYLQFESIGLDRIRTELSVSYVDHNMLQDDFKNPDDHRYLQSTAARYGLYFSRPGNGICHQVHLERFAVPGKTLLGSDSHTPTSSGIGMLAIGAGGMDVALSMAGVPFTLKMPKVIGVKLTGRLKPFVSAKDIILEILRIKTVKGGVGAVFEYWGPGVKTLGVPERATITNMGAELGATTSIFPSDEITGAFLRAQDRFKAYRKLKADPDALYDEILEIDLSQIEPMIALPHSPDNVKKVREVRGVKVQQVAIGSCTNSSYRDLMTVAHMVKGRVVAENLSAGIAPGSRQVLEMIARDGGLKALISAGLRIFETGCGSCIGMGFAPSSSGVTVRSFNRNFEGRTGTKDAQVYLASPQTCVAAALKGEITDPRDLKIPAPRIKVPWKFIIDDRMILAPLPEKKAKQVQILRGPNIAPLPQTAPLQGALKGEVLLKLSDNITTDHIMPAGAKILPLRSNVPAISEYVFERVDKTFPKRALQAKADGKAGFVVGGINYGQGSSREHAALAPMYLGVKAIITKAFARIHLANLINFGILGLTFKNESDYDLVSQGDEVELDTSGLEKGVLSFKDKTACVEIPLVCKLSEREIRILRAGGALAHVKMKSKEKVNS